MHGQKFYADEHFNSFYYYSRVLQTGGGVPKMPKQIIQFTFKTGARFHWGLPVLFTKRLSTY